MIKTALLLLWIIAIAATFLGFLLFLIGALFPKKEPVPKKKEPKFFPMEEIEKKVQDAKTSPEEIMLVVKSLATHHPLPEKVNNKSPKEAKPMLDMIFTLSGHTNMTDEMREDMFTQLRISNPQYAKEFANGR